MYNRIVRIIREILTKIGIKYIFSVGMFNPRINAPIAMTPAKMTNKFVL